MNKFLKSQLLWIFFLTNEKNYIKKSFHVVQRLYIKKILCLINSFKVFSLVFIKC